MDWAPSPASGKQPSLATLLEQSRKLLPAQRQDLPFIELGLDQIEQQSRKLAQRQREAQQHVTGQTEEQLAKAHYMLARAQVDTSQLTRTLNQLQPTAAFTALQPHHDNDLAFLSKQAHESALISCIEEGRRRTVNDFYTNMRQEMIRDWDRKKFQVLEDLARHHPALVSTEGMTDAPGTPTGTPQQRRRSMSAARRTSGNQFEPYSQSLFNQQPAASGTSELHMHAKMMKYDHAVARINGFRKRDAPVATLTVLADAATSTASQNNTRALPLMDTYNLLKAIVGEHEASADGDFQHDAVSARAFAAAYLAKDADAEKPASIQLRQQIANGSKHFLEEQFIRHVESTLAKHPQSANLGGEPGISNTIRAYVSVLYYQSNAWAPNLEVVNGSAIYPRLFFLIRAGRTEEAVKLATSPEFESSLVATEPNFVTYLKAWAPSRSRPTGGLSRSVRDRFQTEYNQRIRYLSAAPGSTSSADPFKIALYKLFGRAELNKRNVQGVTDKTEHWLWLQLALIREDAADGLGASTGGRISQDQQERYGLRDFAAVLRKFGEAHWDPKGARPGLYFQVLLMSGQFERAVAFLYLRQPYRTDAVHFAIGLAYYGLLRVAEQSQTSELELLTATLDAQGYEVCHLNFSRLLHRYYRAFAKEDPTHALQYIASISLCLQGGSKTLQQEQRAIVADYVKELLVESKAYAPLLGELSTEGRTAGAVVQNAKLLAIDDSRLFVQQLVKAVVNSVDNATRFNDSILLYNLAEDYNGVLEVLNSELGNSLGQSSATSAAGQQDVLDVAKSVMDHYERNRFALDRKKKDTTQKLIKIKEAFVLYDAGKLDDALVTLESVQILPLAQDTDIVPVIKTAEDFKELDETITRNFDAVMLTAMNIIYALHQQLKESPYGDSSRQNKMADIKKRARAIMMFAGLLRYRLNANTYHELSRREVFIH